MAYGARSRPVFRTVFDPALEAFLAKSGVQLIKPGQYMDKWRLDRKWRATGAERRGEAGARFLEGPIPSALKMKHSIVQ